MRRTDRAGEEVMGVVREHGKQEAVSPSIPGVGILYPMS